MAHPSLAYAHAYESAETIFGEDVPSAFLIERVRSFSWVESYIRLARLAALVANDPMGPRSERVRRATIDPLLELSGSTRGILAKSRNTIVARRDQMVVAHEEVISFLQHLVILEGADDGDAPGASEIALWLAGANDHLARWAKEDAFRLPDDERLAAELVRVARFNNKPDLLRALVRTHHVFSTRPSIGPLSNASIWSKLQAIAFPASFDGYFETGLGLLAMLAPLWSTEGSSFPHPCIDVSAFVKNTRVSKAEFLAAVEGLTATREHVRREVSKRLRSDGLPHSPTALMHTPLVEIGPELFVAASPWALVGQLRTGIWARYIKAAKKQDPKKGADDWLSGFGYMVEDWCRFVAQEANAGELRNAKILLPTSPGAPDEVEDVVVVEGNAAVLFSVKGRLVEARVAREAPSPGAVLTWFEDFFFEEKGEGFRGGAARQLSRRIDMLRAGDFEYLGVPRQTPVIPVVVTYDTLGENDQLYGMLETRCRTYGLLQQSGVGTLVLARLEEFEQLMSMVSRGVSIVDFFMKRMHDGQPRRLDQLLHEEEPPSGPPRLPFFEVEHKALTSRIRARFWGNN